ncbi:uncharacterized protein LOC128468158 [Spea bombifrons]|uniref:uncharacterized protein LOC128468158 n=1 Tax=Spea bombifrons TaxID=233779 RepID=UPI00234AEB30|nr:uncharacterized protein LOC128468158 [Spea bombifrons]
MTTHLCGKLATMKTIIVLALVGVCVALQNRGRQNAFSFPGKPVQAVISEKRSLEFPAIEASAEEEKSSNGFLEQRNFVLSNPHHRNVRLGGQNLPQFGFHAAIPQEKQPDAEDVNKDSSESSPIEETAQAVTEQDQKSSREEAKKDDNVSSSEEQLAKEEESVPKKDLENEDSAVLEEQQAEPPKLFNRFSFIHPRGQSLLLQGSRAEREISEDVPAGIELNPSGPVQGFSSLNGNVRNRKQYKRVRTIRLVPK